MNNLSKRIITSIILIFIVSISLFYNKYIWLFTLILVSLVLFIEFNNLVNKIWKKEKKTILKFNIFSSLFLLILIYVSYESYNNPPTGLVFIILICIFSDTGGYLIGNLIGGKKLTKISPNKTISGSIGSFLFSLMPIVIFWGLYNFTNDLSFKAENSLKLIPICLFLSLICQLGDLFISYFKRKAKVEDTGSILPGHGGLLDRIDGIIFVLPAAYLIDKIFF
tara:strand:+ start:312 stop:980 length:669 start_codon:yes stop_codon:yes gene_type:complete